MLGDKKKGTVRDVRRMLQGAMEQSKPLQQHPKKGLNILRSAVGSAVSQLDDVDDWETCAHLLAEALAIKTAKHRLDSEIRGVKPSETEQEAQRIYKLLCSRNSPVLSEEQDEEVQGA